MHTWIKNSIIPQIMCHQGIWARKRTTRTYRKILASSNSNFEVDPTSYYRELITLEYLMILNQDTKLKSLTYIQSPYELVSVI